MTQNLDESEDIFKELYKIVELHKFNFGEGGLIKFARDGSDYNFGKFKNGEHNLQANDLCDLCDGCKREAQFTCITHGTHMVVNPVLFVMGNPGAVDDRDEQVGARRVSNQWYLVMGQDKRANGEFFYPQYFIQKEYGWMVYSAIRTFKMANAYVTNMVKWA